MLGHLRAWLNERTSEVSRTWISTGIGRKFSRHKYQINAFVRKTSTIHSGRSACIFVAPLDLGTRDDRLLRKRLAIRKGETARNKVQGYISRGQGSQKEQKGLNEGFVQRLGVVILPCSFSPLRSYGGANLFLNLFSSDY